MDEISNVRKFLDFLGAAEGATYNTIVGGGSFSDYTKHPRVVGLTTKEGPSTAAGKYQITKTTYDDIAPKLGITDFSPESQDKIAVELIKRNGALEDVRIGNFEAAVSKLGGTWASLPSSPYSQGKKSAQWVNDYFGGKVTAQVQAPPALENQPTDTIAPTYNPGASQLAFKEAQDEAKYGGIVNQVKAIPDALMGGLETQSNTYNWFKNQSTERIDPDLKWTKELVAQATEGIPEANHGYILQGVNKDDIFARKAKVQESLKTQQELSSMGAVGVAGNLIGGLADVSTLVGLIPGLGEAALVSKTSRIANALATGLAMAGTNVAVDAAMMKYRPLGTTEDLYWSAAAGLAFGLPIGAAANPARAVEKFGAAEARDLAKWAQKEVNSIQVKELSEAGLELSEKGKKVFDPTYRAEAAAKAEVEAVKAEAKEIPKFKVESNWTDFEPKTPSGKPYPSKPATAVLDELAQSADPKVAALAKILREQVGDDVKLYTLPKSAMKRELGTTSTGAYMSDNHIVAVTQDALETTKIHEIAHALTVHKLEYGKANPNTVHGHLYKEMESVYNQALDEAKKAGFDSYYLKNMREFTAALYGGRSAKEVVDFLSKIKTDGNETLLAKVVDIMRRLMGFGENEANLYLKSLDISDRLINEKLDLQLVRKQDGSLTKEISLDDPEMKDFMPEKGNVGFTSYGPGLENFFAKEWVPQPARDIFNKLAGSTTGYKDHAVVKQSAWDQTLALGDGWATRLDKSYKPAFNQYFKELQDAGQATRWQRAEIFDRWEQEVGNYIRGIDGNYHPSVIKTGNDVRALLRDAVDHINNPAKFNGGVKKGLTQIEETDPETGAKSLTDPLPYNENYLPRHPDVSKFNSMTAQFGAETVQGFLGNAFKAANPNASDAVAKRFGKWYFNNLQDAKLNRMNDGLDNMLRGFDREGFKESLMKHGSMTDVEADEIIMALFPGKKDKANPLHRNLKSRSSMDETYTEQILMKDGSTYNMSLNDLIDTRTFDVLENYFRKTAGSISLANQLDVYKAADVDKLIKNATSQEFGSAMPGHRIEKTRELLNFTVDRILGRPVENFTPLNKTLEMWRGFNVTRLMGGAVWNQVQELSQIVGSLGWKTTLRAIPELRAMLRDAKTGKVANEMLDQLENLTGGAGADLLRRTDFHPRDEWVRQMGDTSFNKWLDRADNALSQTSQGVLKWTGMTGVMIQQKRIHAIAMINHFVEAANGKVKLAFSKDRLAWMGLDEADTAKVLDGIKTYHSEVKGSKVGTVDFQKWQEADPETYAKFIVAYQREARRVVQENDLAAMVPIMGKGWGQTLFQFMNFSLQGWNKSMNFAMNHKDYQTLSTVLHGSMFAAATYIARTNLELAGKSAEERADFAEKRLSTKQIVANSIGRIAQVSVLPVLIDSTVAPVPFFSGARTTSNVTDFVGSNPTLSAISTLLQVPRKLTRAGFDEEYQISEKDMRNFFRVLPMNNVVGISNVLNAVAADYPNTNKQE